MQGTSTALQNYWSLKLPKDLYTYLVVAFWGSIQSTEYRLNIDNKDVEGELPYIRLGLFITFCEKQYSSLHNDTLLQLPQPSQSRELGGSLKEKKNL